MSLADLGTWLEACSNEDTVWYLKRLSANDTLATDAHQAGPYIPRSFLLSVLPALNRSGSQNPDVRFPLSVDSHGEQVQVRAVWYNNKLFGGTRNETRLTNFGGRSSALLDPENTGALAAFVFRGPATEPSVQVWVARSTAEEEIIEDRVGPVEPGQGLVWSAQQQSQQDLFIASTLTRTSCSIKPSEMPPMWLKSFPTGAEIIRKAIALRPAKELDVDGRIVRRRECEYELFRSVEEAVELPNIEKGFTTIDSFIARAQTILQRRKSRSGRSLELQVCELLIEERFEEGVSFSHGPESESGKQPDFLFPSEFAYRNAAYPSASLRMLAAKTTCKDRWRQILNEADRVSTKHLLTLQEGVSENQYLEMSSAGVRLVVPRALHSAYPATVRPGLLTLAGFFAEIRDLAAKAVS